MQQCKQSMNSQLMTLRSKGKFSEVEKGQDGAVGILGVFGVGVVLGALKNSNVKTVKEQTFHNVPQTFRYLIGMKQKTIEFFPEFFSSKEILSILAQESRFWTKSKQSVFNKRNLGRMTKRFRFVSKRYRNICPLVFDITQELLNPEADIVN
jgi:hypothetical protein